jgi:type IX secretion system PorP/SprF family membrane protein
MRKLIIVFFFSLFSSLLFGQQLPQYSLYMLNEVIVNPAALSKENNNKIILMLTDQWSGFEGAPTTQSISYNHLNHKKFKAGVNVMNDVTGPISIINGTLSGSYSIPLQGKDRFAFGVSASIMQYKFDNSDITLENDGLVDPAISTGIDNATGNSFAVGIFYYHPDYYFGLSAPNIIGSSLDISDNKNDNSLEGHYYLNGGVNINLKDNNKIIPSLMIKKQGALPMQFDLNVRGVYHDFLWTGVSLRTGDAIVALFGINYGQSVFGYSYDITTSTINIPSAGTHGLVYSYKFKSKPKDRDKDGILDSVDVCPRTPGIPALQGCPDKDKDGIKDSDDDCPDEFGLKINNGCPDKDSDGVIDKKDECPETPGVPKFKGCSDRDGDGLQDKFDECPDEFGPLLNKGCPKSPAPDTIFITITDTVYVSVNDVDMPIYIQAPDDLKEVFKYIKFEYDKYVLTQSSKSALDQVADYMMLKSYLKILLIGHTDSEDTQEYNLELSKNRVRAVQRYLSSNGVSNNRITIDWKGEEFPIADNNTKEGREKNRRVELKILNEK